MYSIHILTIFQYITCTPVYLFNKAVYRYRVNHTNFVVFKVYIYIYTKYILTINLLNKSINIKILNIVNICIWITYIYKIVMFD